jgi:hypothetical protein
MSRHDPLFSLSTVVNQPTAPSPEFARRLRAQLLDELAAAGSTRRHLSGADRIRALPGRRRIAVLIVLLLVLAGIATAAAVGLEALLAGDAARPTGVDPAVARLAEREPAQITITGGPVGGNLYGGAGRFTLRIGSTVDAGEHSYSVWFGSSGTSAAAQPYVEVNATLYLTGEKGRLVLAARGLSYGASGDGAVDGQDVWRGSWTVVGGSGAYANMHGGGDFVGIAGPGARIELRLTGRLG